MHTRLDPWTLSVNEKTPDGYIALLHDGQARIVADGFIGTDEVRFDAAEEWLYVVESNALHIFRLRAAPDGSLTDREVFGPEDLGGVPDGFAFDEHGTLWTMTPEVLGGGRGTLAPMMASVTFGGPDLRTVYLGRLMGQTPPSFRSPVPGLSMAHWHRHA